MTMQRQVIAGLFHYVWPCQGKQFVISHVMPIYFMFIIYKFCIYIRVEIREANDSNLIKMHCFRNWCANGESTLIFDSVERYSKDVS
jgi:hypothetical protein